MPRLTLKYDPKDPSSASGAAWVMVGDNAVTHDCGTAAELGKAIDGLQRDLEALRKEARIKFAANDRKQAEARDAD